MPGNTLVTLVTFSCFCPKETGRHFLIWVKGEQWKWKMFTNRKQRSFTLDLLGPWISKAVLVGEQMSDPNIFLQTHSLWGGWNCTSCQQESARWVNKINSLLSICFVCQLPWFQLLTIANQIFQFFGKRKSQCEERGLLSKRDPLSFFSQMQISPFLNEQRLHLFCSPIGNLELSPEEYSSVSDICQQ